MNRILITGGSGFIGTNLVQHWLDIGAEVINIDLQPPPKPEHRTVWKHGDLLDKAGLVRAVADFRPDCLFHLGARTDINGAAITDYAANTTGVENIIAAAKEGGAERVIFTSSQLVCRPGHAPQSDEDYCPPNAYGESKAAGEQIVRRLAGDAFPWVMVRPTSIWGPWFNQPYRAFFMAVKRGRYIQVRGYKVRKSFGYVGNAIFQFAKLAECPQERIHRRILYMADYAPVVVSDWAHLIQKTWGAPPIREFPLGALRAFARIGDGLKRLGMKNPPLSSYRLRNLLTETIFDMEPLQTLCGDLPYSLQQGTEKAIEWLQAQPE